MMNESPFIKIHKKFHENIQNKLHCCFFHLQKYDIEETINTILNFQYYLSWHINFEERNFLDAVHIRIIDKHLNNSPYKSEHYFRDHKLILDKTTSFIINLLIIIKNKEDLLFQLIEIIEALEHHDERESHGYLRLLDQELEEKLKNKLINGFQEELDQLNYSSESFLNSVVLLNKLLIDLYTNDNFHLKKLSGLVPDIDHILFRKLLSKIESYKEVNNDLLSRYKFYKQLRNMQLALNKILIERERYKPLPNFALNKELKGKTQ